MIRFIAPTCSSLRVVVSRCRKRYCMLLACTLPIPSVDIIPWANACLSTYGIFEVVQILCKCISDPDRAGLEHVDFLVTQNASAENNYYRFAGSGDKERDGARYCY
jgi:hypothetical protein